MNSKTHILAIESSCDDTAAAVLENGKVRSNLIANQEVHTEYGGVVPELASRAHQQNILPVVVQSLKKAELQIQDIDAIAYTEGPGLLGSLLVGSSFAKGLGMALQKPLIGVNHMHAHILAHFIEDENPSPKFPFFCLTVSGGHTQIVLVEAPLKMKIIGQTLDDAAGEAFDKAAKMMQLPYPGGPLIDQYAKKGNPDRFHFKVGEMKGYDYSFSGIKTGILNFLKKSVAESPSFIEDNLHDLCASIQKDIVDALFKKLEQAVADYGIKEVAIAGGVSANSAIRKRLKAKAAEGWEVYIPKFEYCTDNAAMIGIAGYYKFLEKQTTHLSAAPKARLEF